MKLKQLLEGPIFIPSSPREGWESDDYLSNQTLRRLYTHIGTTIFNNTNVDFFMLKNNKKIIGCIKSPHPFDNVLTNKEIFVLVLDKPNISIPIDLQTNKLIQTKDVSTDINFGGQGLATFVYFNILVDKLGYTVVCDDQHYFGGIRLWRKMSRQALNHHLKICLIKNGEYVLDKNGQLLIFDDTNFPKSKIWSTLPNQAGKDVLFVIKRIE